MTAAEIDRAVRRAAGAGTPLQPRLRAALEQALNARLGEVRLHTDDRLVAAAGADAFAAGSDIFLRTGLANPERAAGLELLVHELVHTLQPLRSACPAGEERQARAVAAAVRRGERPGAGRAPVDAARRDPDEPAALRRHASWEHRLLGDARPGDLNAIALNQSTRIQLLTQLRDFLWMWHQDPDSVTEAMIRARYPYIRTLRLATSGLLVTYGELNTLPDYMADPQVLDAQPRAIMLPILQAVRQEGYNRIQRLLGGSTASFASAVGINTGWDFIDLLLETKGIDNLTKNIGPAGTNHYTGLVGRNACHFAPYSWYRWEQHYLIARNLAQTAHGSADAAAKAKFTYAAWMYHGYADHFLQDSFAAGHLINKTLVMQWFVDWAAGKWYVPVYDWDRVKTMSVAQQPGICAPGLYNPAAAGAVRDPQTGQEQATLDQRVAMTGVAAGGAGLPAAYQNYLAFLNSTTVQSASGVLHDYYNAQSLWVASTAQPTPYRIWGDDTMLDGGDGVRIAAETAQLSQQSILDLLGTGTTQITPQAIRDRFPTMVRGGGGVQPLWDWHATIKAQAYALFPGVHYYLLRAMPTIGGISVDQQVAARVVPTSNAAMTSVRPMA